MAIVTEHAAVAQTRAWIESVVIELGLCPFAREVLDAGRVRIELSRARDEAALLADLEGEMQCLAAGEGAAADDTTFLVHPWVLGDFRDFNEFLSAAEARLRALRLEGVLQIASFHPEYCFEDAAPADSANYTNRSPHPMLHLLREASITRALEAYPDPSAIPERNVARLRELGAKHLEQRLARCRARTP
jgi:hypothetical protein